MGEKKRIIIRAVVFGVIVSIGAIIMVVLMNTKKASIRREVAPEARLVRTMPLEYKDRVVTVQGNGLVEARQTLQLIAEVRGLITYSKGNLKSGTFVKAGEVICKIDEREAENNLHSMRSEFMRVLTAFLSYARLEDDTYYTKWYDYFSQLDINKEVPDIPEITDPREKIQISNHKVLSQYYLVKNAEITYSKHQIVAPFDGFISGDGVLENSFVNVGQTIATVQDARNLEVSVPLLLEDAQWIDFDVMPEVAIHYGKNENQIVWGKLVRKDARIERSSQSMNVHIDFTNDSLIPGLFPGNYVSVSISGILLHNVAKIPRYILDNDDRIFYVSDGKLMRHDADVLAIEGDDVFIGRSLPEGIRIITTILQKPLLGMLVQDMDTDKEDSVTDLVDKE